MGIKVGGSNKGKVYFGIDRNNFQFKPKKADELGQAWLAGVGLQVGEFAGFNVSLDGQIRGVGVSEYVDPKDARKVTTYSLNLLMRDPNPEVPSISIDTSFSQEDKDGNLISMSKSVTMAMMKILQVLRAEPDAVIELKPWKSETGSGISVAVGGEKVMLPEDADRIPDDLAAHAALFEKIVGEVSGVFAKSREGKDVIDDEADMQAAVAAARSGAPQAEPEPAARQRFGG